jgi:hypothetical protein
MGYQDEKVNTHYSSVVDEVVQPIFVQYASDMRQLKRFKDRIFARYVHLEEM